MSAEAGRPQRLADALARLEAEPLPATFKGVPAAAVGRPLSALGELGLSITRGEVPLPAAVLKESALAHNLEWMRRFTQRAGVELCPHGKTTMAPQLFARQLAAGSWGITAATAAHVRTYRRFGIERIFLANELIGEANIALVLEELERGASFEFYCLVDSLAGLEQLRRALGSRMQARPLQVLLELGFAGGRTGVRGLESAVELGRTLRSAVPGIALRGIEAYEGIVAGGDAGAREAAVQALFARCRELLRVGLSEDWFAPGEVLMTAGGSEFFDLAALHLKPPEVSRPIRVIVRSGCYLTHDVLHYGEAALRMRQRSPGLLGEAPGLRNALEVWADVQSVPEQRRAICGLGKRDISYDMKLPQPLRWVRAGETAVRPAPSDWRVSALNDQHAYLDGVSGPLELRVGDRVAFGVAHPCTTFDKWPLLLVVDDDDRVTGAVRTFF